MDMDDIADLAAGLEGVTEKRTEGLRGWYLRDRLVARQVDDRTLLLRCDFELRDRLLADHPTTFSVTSRTEGHMKVLADLEDGDPDAVEEALVAAWELQSSMD